MSILEILEAHTCHTHTTPHSIGYWARCTCGWTSEGQQSHDYDFTPEHRAHVAQVLKQHEREREAAAVREAGKYISLLHRGGLVDHRGVLADIEIAADRIGRGFHAGGRDKEPRDGRE